MADLLNTAVSGLLAFQRSLSVTGHNITNVNTEGYSRQDVEFVTRLPEINGNGFVGTGVNISSIQRMYDQFLADNVTRRTSTYNQLDTLDDMASQVDMMLADEEVGMSPAIQDFFNAVQDVANNPASVPARQVLLSQGETMAGRFQALDQKLGELRDNVNNQLDAMVNEMTSIATSIAEVNADIALSRAESGGQPPNDLLDKRDVLVNRLAEFVSVRTVDVEDGSLNVFIGNGQPLVLGNSVAAITTSSNNFDPTQKEVSYSSGAVSYSISDQISGGKLGGLLEFRNEVLDPAQNALGRIAIGLADTFNTQHQLGDDLNGNAGGLFFDDIVNSSPEVLPNTLNNPASGTLSVTIDDTNFLKASDYRLNYDGANFSLTRLSDNVVVDSGFTTAAMPRTIASDGITISLAGSVAPGDSFLIRPVRSGAGDMGVSLTDAASFAAAASGNAMGDNTNALALAAMQTAKILGGGSETYQTAYGKMVASVGVKASEAKVNSSAQKALLDRAVEKQTELSGVNLDEEAANLVKYQQAYQAAAQVVRIANDVFQTLLGATAR
jgi:flagellar hook-associated protein 1 FlgK